MGKKGFICITLSPKFWLLPCFLSSLFPPAKAQMFSGTPTRRYSLCLPPLGDV